MFKNNIYLIAFASAISGLLFGYDAGIIASAMLFIKNEFVLSAHSVGVIVSAVPLGALLSSLVSGRLSDAIGRKKSLLLSAGLFLLGSLICMLALQVSQLVLGRVLLGLAIGIGSCVSPVYTSELSKEQQRGWLVNLFVVMIQFGIFISFVAGYLFSANGSWRLMIGLGMIPAVLLGVGALFLPESPRWLVVRGLKQEAHTIFAKMYDKEYALFHVKELEKLLAYEKQSTHKMFHAGFIKAILIGVAVSFFTQTVGINVLNYYAPTIFQTTGFSTPKMAIFVTMLMGLVLTLSTIASLFFIDKIGRRLPLLIAMKGILASLLLIACAFAFVKNPMLLGWLMFAGTIMFMIFHGMGVGPACFLIPSEIFPARVRGLGMGLSVASNWSANVLVAYFVPLGLVTLGAANLFFIFFLISAVGYLVFYWYVPETSCVSLETIEKNMLDNVKARDLGRISVSPSL